MQSLREFPELGRARDDLFPGCRIHRIQQHYILYRIDETAIRVVRILHVMRDLASALNQ
jgi:plasmid stabilization system protein ParE